MNHDALSAIRRNMIGLHNEINTDIALVTEEFRESRQQQSDLMRSLVNRSKKNQRDLDAALQLIDKLIEETKAGGERR